MYDKALTELPVYTFRNLDKDTAISGFMNNNLDFYDDDKEAREDHDDTVFTVHPFIYFSNNYKDRKKACFKHYVSNVSYKDNYDLAFPPTNVYPHDVSGNKILVPEN